MLRAGSLVRQRRGRLGSHIMSWCSCGWSPARPCPNLSLSPPAPALPWVSELGQPLAGELLMWGAASGRRDRNKGALVKLLTLSPKQTNKGGRDLAVPAWGQRAGGGVGVPQTLPPPVFDAVCHAPGSSLVPVPLTSPGALRGLHPWEMQVWRRLGGFLPRILVPCAWLGPQPCLGLPVARLSSGSL